MPCESLFLVLDGHRDWGREENLGCFVFGVLWMRDSGEEMFMAK